MNSNRHGFSPLQFTLVIVAMLGIGLISHFMDESPRELTFLKVVMTPVIVLASYGLAVRSDFDEAYRRWSQALVERVAVSSFITAASVTLLLARPESSFEELAGYFAAMFVVFAIIATFGPFARRKRP
jgi:hypothetical protein